MTLSVLICPDCGTVIRPRKEMMSSTRMTSEFQIVSASYECPLCRKVQRMDAFDLQEEDD